MLSPLAATRVLSPLAVGALALAPTLEDVVWTSIVNCAVDAPNTLRKSLAGSAWNAGACSTKAILSGAGYCEWTDDGTNYKICGLSLGNPGVNYAEIDFAIYRQTAAQVYNVAQNGTFFGTGVFATPGTVLRISVSAAGVVTYYVGGVLKYTSLIPATYPLLVDGAIYQSATLVTGAKIYGLLGASGF